MASPERSAPKPLRLFVAVDLPEGVKRALAEAIEPHRDRIPGARWTNPSGWHVTLRFLGSTRPRLLDEVGAAVEAAAAACEPFGTALTEIGAFPGVTGTRVVWAGLSDPDQRFGQMVKSLDDSLGGYYEPERRAFTPHLTLARLNPPRRVAEFAPDLIGSSVWSEPFVVDHLTLYRSHLSPRGATYEALRRAIIGTAPEMLDPEQMFE